MAVVDSDIVYFGSQVMANDDLTTQIGGAIDLTTNVIFVDIDPDGTVEALSDGADTRMLTIHFIDNTGVVTSETRTLTGAAPVAFTSIMKTILRAVLSAPDGVRTVTIRETGPVDDLIVLGPTIITVRRVFHDVIAEGASGNTRTYFDKVFVKNTNGVDSLTASEVLLIDDVQGVITFALEFTLDGITDNGVGNNRQVAPIAFVFDQTTKAVANSGNLTPGSAQGIWLQNTLPQGFAAQESTFSLRLAGVAA